MAPHNMFLTIWTLIFCLIGFTLAQTPDSQCFWKADNTTVAEGNGWYACNNTATTLNGASLCCIEGSQCGEDSLCHYPSGSEGGSGWYVGGCTDGSYNDPICPRECTNFAHTWIQYNDTEQLWHCCGDGDCDGTPSSETFQAVAPAQWSALPSKATSTASHSTSATGTATGKGNANDKSGDSSGLSTGAQAGIGVAAGVVGLAIIAALAFWCLRRRKNAKKIQSPSKADAEQMVQYQAYDRQQQDHQYTAVPAYPGSPEYQAQRDGKPPMPLQLEPGQRAELGVGTQSPQELANNEARAELGNGGSS